MADDINRQVPAVTLIDDDGHSRAAVRVIDNITSVHIEASVHTTDRSQSAVTHNTAFDIRVTDWADVEKLHEHLGKILDNRAARIAALPVYIARYIDDPAFPTQRLSVQDNGSSLAIGTHSELERDWVFIQPSVQADPNGRAKYFVRRKI